MVGVSLEALHSRGEAAKRPAQQLREQPARQERHSQDRRRQPEGEVYHLVHVPVNELVHIAHADDSPAAVAHAVKAVDDGVVRIGAVLQLGEGFRVFRFESGI